MTGITAALSLPASSANKATCYLFQGTWAARYEQNGAAWEFRNPFDLPQHLTWFWPGLAGTAGHRPYPAVFADKGEIFFLRPDHLVRYNIAKNEVQSEADAKPENTFDVEELPDDFLAGLSGAMDTPKGVYLFSGPRWALFKLKDGSLKKHGTLESSLPNGVDAGCWPDKSANGYLFSGEKYHTCTADAGGTLTAAPGGAITDLWQHAPLKRPLADIYASGLGMQPVRFRTAIDLSTDTLPGKSAITAKGTVIKGADLRATGDRSSWSISGDGKHGFLVNDTRIVAVDLAEITGDDPVIRTKNMDKTLWDCALSRDGEHLWTGGFETRKRQKMLHRVDVGKVDSQDLTVTSYDVLGAVFGVALSAKSDKVYPGVLTETNNLQVPVTNTLDGSLINTLSGDNGFGKPLVAVSVDGGTVALVVGDGGGSVKAFKGQDAPRTIPVGNQVYGLAVTPDGTLLCAVAAKDTYSAAVVDLSTATGEVRHIELPGIRYPRGVAIDPNGRFAYVAGYVSSDSGSKARLWVIDLPVAKHCATVEADWGSTETEIDDVKIAWRWE
ncbi:YncE family protein [Kitasatospora sp. NPDC048286]|uniref:YncE family protein n=1 Tax=Kitasatospora sp. NPDC048286 TaxID=3364047 RepID=UPI0037106300